jgi:hypothetical protein
MTTILLRCEKGHELERYITSEDGYYCDCCSEVLPEGSTMYGCNVCEWDLCPPCFVELDDWHKESTKQTSSLPTLTTGPSNTSSSSSDTVTTNPSITTATIPKRPVEREKSNLTSKSPRKWGLVKLKLDAKEDSFKNIVVKPSEKTSISSVVKDARNKLKQQKAQAKMDARRTMKKRNAEYKKRLANIKAAEKSGLSKETLAARRKLAEDKALQKQIREDNIKEENEKYRQKLAEASNMDEKTLSEETLAARKKIADAKAKAKADSLKSTKKTCPSAEKKIS